MADATSGDIFAALYAAHQAADYWVQTDAQARDKGLPGWRGRRACGAHVASMTACKAAALTALHLSGRRVCARRAAVALAADAASHYWADRRSTLARLAALTGHGGDQGFYWRGAGRGCTGTGAAAMDQAFHILMLWAAALVAGGSSDG